MSGVPRSQRLLAFTWSNTGPSPVWTCPDAFITLVKSIVIANPTAGPVHINTRVFATGLADQLYLDVATIETNTVHTWEGWIVLNPTDGLYLFADAIGATCWVSGAVLAGPPQFPPAARELPTQEPHR